MKDKNDEYWKKTLTSQQYKVLREKDTDDPFKGSLLHSSETGVYKCAACHATLFSSDNKYDSGSGWPSFNDVIDEAAVDLREDKTHNMIRTEIVCSNCKGHLGHLFDDGPTPNGQRYCINSTSLSFEGAKD